MGSLAAMNSLNRVFERHGDELAREAQLAPPRTVLTYRGVSLETRTYEIVAVHEFENSRGETVSLVGEPLDIDTLAERYPDCDVGY